MLTSSLAGLGAIFAGLAALASAAAGGYLKFRGRKQPAPLSDRISSLTAALKESSRLISDMELEIAARQRLVRQLTDDANAQQRLLLLRQDQLDAVAGFLRSEIVAQSNRSFWTSFLQNLGFFLAGSAFSVLLAYITSK